jgi:sugar fermentation stimulation protein A
VRFAKRLAEARLVRRYKRFLADVEFEDGGVETVHCANPGAMTGLTEPGARTLLSRSENPARKLPWSWEMVAAGTALVGINTGLANRLAAEALSTGRIAEVAETGSLRREVRYGERSRVDFVVGGRNGDVHVEVKSVTLSRSPGLAEFPDCVTGRGARHLADLAEVAKSGGRAAMLYVVQRNDADRFALAGDIDPTYATAFDRARAAGVRMLAYACDLSPTEIAITRRIPIVG